MTELYINQKLNQLVKLDFDDMASNPLEYIDDSIKFFIETPNVVNDLIDNLFDGDEEAYQLNWLLQQEEQQAELIKERQQLKKLNSYVGERVIQAGITGVVTGVNKDSKRLIVKLGNDIKEWNIPTTEHHLA